jgi:hypothetical protein
MALRKLAKPIPKSKKPSTVKPKPAKPLKRPFALEAWYASSPAQRVFGAICQAVNEQKTLIGLLGSDKAPLLFLEDIRKVAPPRPDIDLQKSIEEVRTDWAAILDAVSLYDVRVYIQGKKLPRAVLFRNPNVPHPSVKYQPHQFKPQDVQQIMLGMQRVIDKLDDTVEKFDRRITDYWRISNGMSPKPIDKPS